VLQPRDIIKIEDVGSRVMFYEQPFAIAAPKGQSAKLKGQLDTDLPRSLPTAVGNGSTTVGQGGQ
jgi:hypothetical protein